MIVTVVEATDAGTIKETEVRREHLEPRVSTFHNSFVCIDDYDDRRRDYETPDDKLKTAIIKLGEVVSC